VRFYLSVFSLGKLVVVTKRNDYQNPSIVGSFSKEWTEACLRARYSLSSVCPLDIRDSHESRVQVVTLWSAGAVSGRCGGLACPFHTCLWELYAIAFWRFLVGCHNLYRPWVQYPGSDKRVLAKTEFTAWAKVILSSMLCLSPFPRIRKSIHYLC
jgi:hypothetical protein